MGRESIKLFLILEKLKLRSYFNRGTVPCYLVISFIYSICLVEFNKKIAGWSYFSIVTDSGAIYFLLEAAILLSVGLLYLFYLYRNLWRVGTEPYTLVTLVTFAIITLICMILIIYFIQNPVLRAFFSLYIIGGAAIYAYNN